MLFFVLLSPSSPVPLPILFWLYQEHQLQLVSPSLSCSTVFFFSSLARSRYLSLFSLLFQYYFVACQEGRVYNSASSLYFLLIIIRSRDELISDVLIWTPTYGRVKAGRPARTYIQQLCEDTGCGPEDLPEAMNDREKWRESVRDIRASGTTWWWWCLVVWPWLGDPIVSQNPRGVFESYSRRLVLGCANTICSYDQI